jgi:thioredoxin 1
MKKIYSIAMITVLMFAAAGCLDDKAKIDTVSNDNAATPTETIASAPETATAVEPTPTEVAQQPEPTTDAAQTKQADMPQTTPLNTEVRTVNLSDIVRTNTPEVIPALQKLANAGNVVIDFYAPWCGPCKIMSPIIDALSKKYPEITFIKVDIDAYDAISEAFELGGKRVAVKSIPTFFFLKNGIVMDKASGGMTKEAFEKRMAVTFSL